MEAQFSFFTLASVEPRVLKELKVDEHGEPIRKRQQHRKSRNGCVSCKKRKIKCDETQPSCLNCKKRGYECDLLKRVKPIKKCSPENVLPVDIWPENSDSSCSSPTPESQQVALPLEPIMTRQAELPPLPLWTNYETSQSALSSWPFNFPCPYADASPSAQTPSLLQQFFHKTSLLTGFNDSLYSSPISTIFSNADLLLRRSAADQELIHHFETVTAKCLTMSPSVWGTRVLSAAIHQDYLMSAIMLISAAHINSHLHRNDPQRRPVLQHFGNALSGLRLALEGEHSIQQLDDIISCSLLLMQYSWVYMEISPLDSLNIADMFCDTVTLFNGLKSCVMASHGMYTHHESAWSGILGYSPRISLEEYNRVHDFRQRPFYKRVHHQMFCGMGMNDVNSCSADNHNALQRLSVVLCTIEIAGNDLETEGIAGDVYRYLMTWPPFCTDGFLQLVRNDVPSSLCILLYYFAAIVRVSNARIWWMRDRALYMYTLLKQRLEGRCELCTGPAIEFVNARKSVLHWSSSDLISINILEQ